MSRDEIKCEQLRPRIRRRFPSNRKTNGRKVVCFSCSTDHQCKLKVKARWLFFFDKINRGLDQPDYKTQQRSANLDRSTGERILGLATETDEWETRKRENPWRRKIKSGQRQLRENHADSAARKTNGRPKAERWQRLTGSKKIIC
jgi:hypothetical protein